MTSPAPSRRPGGYDLADLNERSAGDIVMSWTWQLEKKDGTVLTSRSLPRESFSSQGDAENWIGENWRTLLDAGVDQVSLLDEGRPQYGPMSLHQGE